MINVLKPLAAFPIENAVKEGTPDLYYIGGLIECKWRRAWPKRDTTIVQVKHYTDTQRDFHRWQWSRGGKCWVMLQVRKEWLLFKGPDAAEYLGYVTRNTLYNVAFRRWTNGLNKEELIRALTMPVN